jgi:RNA polymerase sigma-70 factor (ECF subfamily)
VDEAPRDDELYAAWERGDATAGERLLGRHLTSMGRFFANKVTNAADADDLAFKVFEVCLARLGSFERSSSFRTYLYGIARNVLRDYIKAKTRRAEVDFDVTALEDLGPSVSSVIARRREEQLLLQALRAIPLSYQVALELAYFEGMSRSEVAEVLEVPEGTAASRLRRGRKMIEIQLQRLAESPELLASTRAGLQDWAEGIREQLAGATPVRAGPEA